MRQHLASSLLVLLATLPAAPSQAQDRQPAAGAASDADPAGRHRVAVNNRSRRIIEQVLISPSAHADWGSNLLGVDVIETNGRAAVTYTGPCRADVQVMFEGGAMEARRRVDVCRNATLTIEPGWTLNPNLGGRSQ